MRFQAKLLARGLRRARRSTVRLKERDPGRADPKAARELESIEVDAPADGQPKRVELVHRPKATGERTFILEVEPRPRELQTENNRIERVVTVRKEKLKVLLVDSEPRYEFRYLKNYLEREETIDLNVVLLSSDPEYSEQDRSALPTFPAAKDELFAYDVVIVGDADPSFLSQSQMQNLVEFVTEKGGGILFIAGEPFNPLAYRGTPLELLLPIELAEARNPTAVGNAIDVVPARADRRGPVEPDLPVRRRRGGQHPDLAGPARALLVLRGPAQEAGGAGAGRAPDGRPAATASCRSILYQFVGAGKAMFHAFDDTWRWRFRAGDRYFGRFWVQTIRFLARSQAGRASGRPRSRPTAAATSAASRSSSGPVPQPRPGPAGRRRSTVQVERKGQGPRKLTLKPVAGHAERLRGGPAAGRRGGLRGPPAAPAGPRRADPDGRRSASRPRPASSSGSR